MKNVVIVDYVRTPFAKAVAPDSNKEAGRLGHVDPVDLVVPLVNTLIQRSGANPNDVENLVLGCVHQEAEQGLNLARLTVLHQDCVLPITVQGDSVDKFCASSLRTISIARNDILAGEADLVIAAGVQSMSKVPMGGWNFMLPEGVYKGNEKSFLNMGLTAETLADMYNVSRADQDAFAIESHKKAATAQAAGVYKDEIVPVQGLDYDDCVRADSTPDGLAKLKTPFKNPGTVTAATSSAFTDGAAAVLLASEDYATAHNLPVKARIVAYAGTGLAPEIMGLGPVDATKKALARAGITMADVDVVELNEAFAAQSLAVLREFNRQGMAIDPAKLNIDGGAIAIGHPLGASGARLAGHAANILQRTGKRYALVTLCIGEGQGAAMVLENPNHGKKAQPAPQI